MPSNQSNQNKKKLPENLTPDNFRCVTFMLPNDVEHLALFYGAVWTLSQQIWYERDEARSAKIVADYWRGLMPSIKAAMDSGCAFRI